MCVHFLAPAGLAVLESDACSLHTERQRAAQELDRVCVRRINRAAIKKEKRKGQIMCSDSVIPPESLEMSSGKGLTRDRI